MKTTTRLLSGSLVLAATALANAASPAPDSWGVTRPDSVSEASVTFKYTEDTNLYGTSYNVTANTAAPYALTQVGNVSSGIITVSPKLALNLVPALGLPKDGPVTALSVGYLGEANEFTNGDIRSEESNFKNTFTVSGRAAAGDIKAGLDESFLYVWGAKTDPLQQTNSAYSSALPRERRNQIQEKLTAFAKVNEGALFVRPAVSLQYYNLLINEKYSGGSGATNPYFDYVNYTNRSDAGVGADFGYDLAKAFDTFISWRVGQQIQARYNTVPVVNLFHNDSTFNRVLAGVEGKPVAWLDVSWVAGPDFRRYSDFANTYGIAGSPNRTWLYEEGTATATLSRADSLTASSKLWHWVSSTGQKSYQDAAYGLVYKHVFDSTLAGSVGYKLGVDRYDGIGNRDDHMVTLPFNLTYTPSKEVSVSADFADNNGHAAAAAYNNAGRQYHENVVSLSVRLAL